MTCQLVGTAGARLREILPLVGLKFVPRVETFEVEEIPAYLPSGQGEHVYLLIEKRGLTTPQAVRRLARALEIRDQDIGYAGLKDRHARTRQWLSLPSTDPERVAAAAIEGLTVLQISRHSNKLRTGHNHGNRFVVLLEEVAPADLEPLRSRWEAILTTGLPNRYGPQRFGMRGDNVDVARGLLAGTVREPNPRTRRLLVSALQSAIFNAVLDLRISNGTAQRVLAGDILRRRATGGLFPTRDPAADQERLAAGELDITGPLPGTRCLIPAAGTPARAIECNAAQALGFDMSTLEITLGRLAPGARRPLYVHVDRETAVLTPQAGGRVRLAFTLPSGSYATTLIEALGVSIVRLPEHRTMHATPDSFPTDATAD